MMQPIWVGLAAALGAVVVLLLMRRRGGGEVIDAPPQGSLARPVTPAAAAFQASAPADDPDATAGEMLAAEGADTYLEMLGNWLDDRALEELGGSAGSPASARRIADAARQAHADLLANGQAVVSLPNLAFDASGSKDFRIEFDFNTIDRDLIDDYTLLIRELLRGHKEDVHVVALGDYMMDKATEQSGDDLDEEVDSVMRMAAAARTAWADYSRTGRAEIVLPDFGGKHRIDFRATIDAKVMQDALASLDEVDRTIAAIPK